MSPLYIISSEFAATGSIQPVPVVGAITRILRLNAPVRSSAHRSARSSTTQIAVASRSGSRQIAQGSAVSRLPHAEHGRIAVAAAANAADVDQAGRFPREAVDALRDSGLCGLTVPEAAQVLGVSVRTAERDWTYAKAWLLEAIRKVD